MFNGQVTDIFFDLDHTLWDFERNSALTFEKIFLQNGIHVSLPMFLQVYVPINFEYWKLYREEKVTKEELRYQRLKKTFDTLGMSIDRSMIDRLSDDYIRYLSSFNHIIPHTKEVLDYLRPNYRLHIITNGFGEIQHKKLKNAKILHYFEAIINSEMAGVKKPHPRIFELALAKTRVAPENSLMVGDNLEADILGAQAVGFHTLHFNPTQDSNHDFCKIITHLSEIKSIL
ncbi:YjjG family noncanonical pyrimidine nucleotidase [Flagellimonas lutaonensis]|uniref:5'-nucleotidase n=1 Tax=Flagellimonas lutaonensis TaxID=516051 RepID=A0A0D5YRD9_9FLAO|nr:YjjG family noncanonical pyrimidine nucleotidase [Allomuricauda lutaonensis]AKA34448.1 5'-nucleotidase [Allomuricauda lutaonensis]